MQTGVALVDDIIEDLGLLFKILSLITSSISNLSLDLACNFHLVFG